MEVLNEIISLYDKCPKNFIDDLSFLNSVKDLQKSTKSEEEFVFFSIKYFYLIDKNYILNEIKEKRYDSIAAKLLKDKIINNL